MALSDFLETKRANGLSGVLEEVRKNGFAHTSDKDKKTNDKKEKK